MSDKWPPDWRSVVHGAVIKLPANLLVVVIMLGGLVWFVYSENRNREQVYKPLLTACLAALERPHQ